MGTSPLIHNSSAKWFFASVADVLIATTFGGALLSNRRHSFGGRRMFGGLIVRRCQTTMPRLKRLVVCLALAAPAWIQRLFWSILLVSLCGIPLLVSHQREWVMWRPTLDPKTMILNTAKIEFLLVDLAMMGIITCLLCLAITSPDWRKDFAQIVRRIVREYGGLWWVLNGTRPSSALTWASWFCPLAVLYTVMNILVAKPGSQESADPVIPFLVVTAAFGFAISAMLVPLLSEFDVALGRTSGGAD